MDNNVFKILGFKKLCGFAVGCLFVFSLFFSFGFFLLAKFFPTELPVKEVKIIHLLKVLDEIKLKTKVNENIKLVMPVFSLYTGGAVIMRFENGKIWLWLTPDMVLLPKDEFKAVIAHELGHLISGHVEIKQESYESDEENNQAEADAWAIELVGKQPLERVLRRFLPETKVIERLDAAENFSKSRKQSPFYFIRINGP